MGVKSRKMIHAGSDDLPWKVKSGMAMQWFSSANLLRDRYGACSIKVEPLPPDFLYP